MKVTGLTLCKYIQFESLEWKLVTPSWKYPQILDFADFFYKEMLTSLISFSSRNTFSLDLFFKVSVVHAKVCTIFFFVADLLDSETPQKLPN